MNFYNEYNKLEYMYKSKPETDKCFTDLSILFSDLLIQLKQQLLNKSISE